MSNKLLKSQKAFVSSILSGNFDEEFLNQMVPLGNLDPMKAMQVYRGDYTARMQESLGSTYESVWTVLGDESFTKISQDFISKNNSTSYDLGAYGSKFPEFLKDHEILKDIPFIFDLAFFEREFLKVFHAAHKNHLSANEFQNITNPFSLKLILGQEHFIFNSDFPIRDIWEARNESNEPEIDWSKKDCLIVFKAKNSVSIQNLSPLQYFIIQGLNQKLALEEALTMASGRVSNFQESEISELFSFLISEGLITSTQ